MEEPKKYSFIDALRGWAVVGVVLVHTAQQSIPSSSLLKKLAEQGQYGVQLFYLVSAFTLFLSFHSRRQERNSLKNFFIRRFFRIAPLFYLAIIFYLFNSGFEPTYEAPDGIKWWYVVTTFLFINGFHPSSINSVVPGGWSVAVEMSFYLLVPFCFHYINNLSKSILVTFLSLILGVCLSSVSYKLFSPLFSSDTQYLVYAFSNFYSLHAQASVFCMGFILYFLFKDLDGKISGRKWKASMWLMISIYLMIAVMSGGFALIPKQVLYSVTFLIFSYSLALYPFSLFVNLGTQFLGRISFSIYLSHFWISSEISSCLGKQVYFYNLNDDILFFVSFLLTCLVATVVSTLTHYLIERPGQSIGKYIVSLSN